MNLLQENLYCHWGDSQCWPQPLRPKDPSTPALSPGKMHENRKRTAPGLYHDLKLKRLLLENNSWQLNLIRLFFTQNIKLLCKSYKFSHGYICDICYILQLWKHLACSRGKEKAELPRGKTKVSPSQCKQANHLVIIIQLGKGTKNIKGEVRRFFFVGSKF